MNKRQWMLCALGMVLAVVEGWATLKVDHLWFPILFLGLPGSIPFLLLNGVHGDAEGAAGIVGGILYVLINGVIYWGILHLAIHLWIKRKAAPPKIVF